MSQIPAPKGDHPTWRTLDAHKKAVRWSGNRHQGGHGMPVPSNGSASRRIARSSSRKLDDSQLDLFIALPSDLPARDQQDLMERPFFSLSKNKRTTPIEY